MAGHLAEQLSGAPVSAVYASPLERAQETAAAIAAPHDLDVQTDERLIEWSFWTQWQGTPWEEVRDRSPETFSRYAEDPGSLHPGDSLAAVGARVLEWAADAAGSSKSGIVIGVSHEAPLTAGFLAANHAPMAGFAGVLIPHLQAVRLSPEPAALLDPASIAGLA
jgi:broad specificity phosphatase PhoE